jgi:Tfp pilus assembly protein PilF
MILKRTFIAFSFVAVSAIAAALTPAHAQSNALSKSELALFWNACHETTSDPDASIGFCLEIIRRGYETPENLSVAFENLAYQFLRKKDVKSAIESYTDAIKWNPKNARPWTRRGSQFHSQKEFKRAIEDHTKAIELDRNEKDVWYNRGIAYLEIGENERAIADFREALRVNPQDEDARTRLKQLGASP